MWSYWIMTLVSTKPWQGSLIKAGSKPEHVRLLFTRLLFSRSFQLEEIIAVPKRIGGRVRVV